MGRIKVGDLVGSKFMEGGRSMLTGMDCWGLVMEVFKRYGITIPDFIIDTFAFRVIDAFASEAIATRKWEEVYQPQDKDVPLVVLMRMHPVLITHAGVFIGNGKIIHTMKGTGVIMSRASALQSRIVGYYRYVQDN